MRADFNKVFINNQWVPVSKTQKVRSPYDGKELGEVGVADKKLMSEAITVAQRAFQEMKDLPVYKIAVGLAKMRDYFSENFEEVARDLSEESGKPITIARAEVHRALHTFEDGIEECKRLYGETFSLDRRPWGENREATVKRFPIGVIAAITPFNFPLNLVAHKIVPAIASKNTVVVRPATQTPFCSLHIAKAYENSGLPKGGLNVLVSDYEAADLLSEDVRIKMVSFTGSAKVGWKIKVHSASSGQHAKIALELGGNAAVIVHEDVENLEKAATAVATGGFSNAGQSCISAQRIFVHKKVYDKFTHLLKEKVEALVVGNPREDATQVSSLINTQEADRVEEWLKEAKATGARFLTGGKREGNVIWPTIVVDTTPDMKINCMEVFGPVVSLIPYDHIEKVLQEVNNSEFGLQAGIFTQNINLVHKSYQILEVGGLVINDVPTYRIDHMPYGGVKMSGVGREGVRFAMMEMTEPKLLVITY
jgi:acyl-CoA reductase-like NAD-dependent aldehyde dehydrogenase